jgi:predicted DNA binding CopG/RHH family protein
MEVMEMRNEYDFSKGKLNPYVKKLQKKISLRMDMDIIDYFKKQAVKTGIPYQKLINLYLSDCAIHEKRIQIAWK